MSEFPRLAIPMLIATIESVSRVNAKHGASMTMLELVRIREEDRDALRPAVRRYWLGPMPHAPVVQGSVRGEAEFLSRFGLLICMQHEIGEWTGRSSKTVDIDDCRPGNGNEPAAETLIVAATESGKCLGEDLRGRIFSGFLSIESCRVVAIDAIDVLGIKRSERGAITLRGGNERGSVVSLHHRHLCLK
jgi:hypothetical protein